MDRDTHLIFEQYVGDGQKKPTSPQYDVVYNPLLQEKSGDGLHLGHLTLDVIGLIPGVGIAADIANAVWYCGKGMFLMGAISLISAIPAVGYFSAGGKGVMYFAKLANWLRKGGKVGRVAAKGVIKTGRAAKGASAAVKGAEASVKSYRQAVQDNREKIDVVFARAEQSKLLGKHVPQMRKALDDFEAGNVQGLVPVEPPPAEKMAAHPDWYVDMSPLADPVDPRGSTGNTVQA